MAKDMVIAGDYQGKGVAQSFGNVYIALSFKNLLYLDKTTIEAYEVVTEESRKSAVSGVARGLVGGALLGPVGLLAGISAKNKGTITLVIQFKDGKKSLLEINDKIYKALIQKMF